MRLVKVLVTIIIILSLIIAGGVTYYIIINLHDEGDVVAIVNKRDIREAEFYQELKERYGQVALEELIERRVIRDGAVKHNLAVNKLEVNREYDKFKNDFATEEDFLSYLRSDLGMSKSQFLKEIEHYILWEQLATKDIEISEEEVNLYYQKNMNKYKIPESFHLQQIVVDSEALAHELVNEIENGANFNQIARTMSIDFLTIGNGGDMGYVYVDNPMIDSNIIKTARILKEDELSVIKVGLNYHIIRVLDHKQAYQYAYYEVKDQIRRELALSYAEPLGVVLEKLKKELGVKIVDKSLEEDN